MLGTLETKPVGPTLRPLPAQSWGQSGTGVEGDPSIAGSAEVTEDEAALPAFLRQTRSDIQNKFIDLEWQQRHRVAAGMHPQSSNEATPSQWSRIDAEQDAEVTRRNRYINVEPWASNRVKLNVPAGQSDYINASPIMLKQTVSGATKRYIATQGPKGETAAHMWRMALTETGAASDPAVIIMLTQTYESGKEKCAQYYPLDMQDPVVVLDEHDEFGDGFKASLTLQNVVEDEATRSTIREMELSGSLSSSHPPSSVAQVLTQNETDTHASEPQQSFNKPIRHLLFAGWPDFSIPDGADRTALVHLIALSARLNNTPDPASSVKPRIVHCSAGVGRSGTFIALDFLLQEIAEGAWDDASAFAVLDTYGAGGSSEAVTPLAESPATFAGSGASGAGFPAHDARARDSMVLTGAGRAYDPILEAVDALRRQRMMMVQGEAQFALLYDVCREAWLERHRSLAR